MPPFWEDKFPMACLGPHFFYAVKDGESFGPLRVVITFVRVFALPRNCGDAFPLALPRHCGVLGGYWLSAVQDARRIPVVDVIEILVQRVHAWHVDKEYAARITHGKPFQGLPGVPCGQVNRCSATAEFWYDPEKGHIEVAHQDLHIEPLDQLPKPAPKGFELGWPLIIGERVVHVHHHGSVRFSEETHVVRQGDLRDDAARVCLASFVAS